MISREEIEPETNKPEIDGVLIDTGDPNWHAAVLMHAKNLELTDEERERAQIKTYKRLVRETADSDVDSIHPHHNDEHIRSTSALYNFGQIGKSFWAQLMKFVIGMDAADFGYESVLEAEYTVQASDDVYYYANMDNPRAGAIEVRRDGSKLNKMSTEVNSQFDTARAETDINSGYSPELTAKPTNIG